jgi:hypothetical protein
LIVIVGSAASVIGANSTTEDSIGTGDLIEAASLMRHEGSAEMIAALEALTAAIVAQEE